MIHLKILGTPLGWKAPYVGTKGAFSPRTPIMKQIREVIMEQLKAQQKAFVAPFQGAVVCHMSFFMPIPKAVSKKKRNLMIEGEIRPITRPDGSNLRKFYEDCCNGIVYLDDSQIVAGYTYKWYDEEPRTEIQVARWS